MQHLSPRAMVKTLSPAEAQMIEIAKALVIIHTKLNVLKSGEHTIDISRDDIARYVGTDPIHINLLDLLKRATIANFSQIPIIFAIQVLSILTLEHRLTGKADILRPALKLKFFKSRPWT